MKKIFSFIIVVVMAFSCKAQQIVPIEKEWEYLDSLPEGEYATEGTYYKDVNHVLDKYKGKWEGNFQSKSFLFNITISKHEFYGIYRDNLSMDYTIKDSQSNYIINSIEYDKSVLGLGFTKENKNTYELFYTGLDDNDVFCGDKGTIYLDIAQDGKTMQLFIIPSEALISEEECPKGGINPPFPDETQEPMVLRKIE